ncbi:hypothetical protein PENTCL1PPCAC_972, partial [Pristionchus entomophagus]
MFKKFTKANLFQMASSDVRERFHTMALLFVVDIRNMKAVSWNIDLFAMMPNLRVRAGAKMIANYGDAVLTSKFAKILLEKIFFTLDFTITIAFDVVKIREESAFSDYS